MITTDDDFNNWELGQFYLRGVSWYALRRQDRQCVRLIWLSPNLVEDGRLTQQAKELLKDVTLDNDRR